MATTVGKRPAFQARIRSVWWIVLARGILYALWGIVGIVLLFATQFNKLALLRYMAALWLLDGILMLILGFYVQELKGLQFARGIVAILASLLVFANPIASGVLTPLVLAWIIGVQAIFACIVDVITAGRVRSEVPDEWSWVLSAALQGFFGVIVIFSAFYALGLIVPFIIGFGIIGGIGMIYFSQQIRKVGTGELVL